MKLIADSGSTKTDWVLIGEQQVLFTSSGLNPNILKDEEIILALNNIKELTDNKSTISELFFYGAGCGSPANCSRLETIFKQLL